MNAKYLEMQINEVAKIDAEASERLMAEMDKLNLEASKLGSSEILNEFWSINDAKAHIESLEAEAE